MYTVSSKMYNMHKRPVWDLSLKIAEILMSKIRLRLLLLEVLLEWRMHTIENQKKTTLVRNATKDEFSHSFFFRILNQRNNQLYAFLTKPDRYFIRFYDDGSVKTISNASNANQVRDPLPSLTSDMRFSSVVNI